jgi:hypothetical protein
MQTSGYIEGLTAKGRTTARLLHFNDPERIDFRRSVLERENRAKD